jgi:segregation and condensation protein A
MNQLSELHVIQQEYEGPLDVLLQMLHKRELDITTVSLSLITHDFLEYVETVGEHNPALLGEFLAVASRLVHLKSSLIFPNSVETENEEDEAISLDEQLRYYELIKKAADELAGVEGSEMFPRATDQKPLLTVFTPISTEEMQRLNELFAEIMEKINASQKNVQEEVIEREITIEQQMDHIHKLMRRCDSVALVGALRSSKTRLEIVVSFLAILELLKQNVLRFDGVNLWKVQVA